MPFTLTLKYATLLADASQLDAKTLRNEPLHMQSPHRERRYLTNPSVTARKRFMVAINESVAAGVQDDEVTETQWPSFY